MKKKITKAAALAAAVLMAFSALACQQQTEETTTVAAETEAGPIAVETVEIKATETEPPTTTTEEPEPEIPEGYMISYLTGELVPIEIGMRRPVAFQIDNERDALPQDGIASADVVYEVPIEANEVRFTMIIQDYDDLERIGPVRSARSYHPGIAAEYDAIFFHDGHSGMALERLHDEHLDDIDGVTDNGYAAVYTADDHISWHKTFTRPELVNRQIEKLGYRTTIKEGWEGKFNFAPLDKPNTLEGAQDATRIDIGYTQNYPYFIYDPDEGVYYRWAYNQECWDEECDRQVSVSNIIVQYCTYHMEWDDLTKNIHTQTTELEDGVFFTNGKTVPIKWTKPDYWGNTTYYYENGEEIELNPGKTWVCIVLKSMTGTVSFEA